MKKRQMALVKLTLLAAFEQRIEEAALDAMGEGAAAILRDHAARTVACEHDQHLVTLPPPSVDDTDEILDALATRYPSDGLGLGPLPKMHLLGRTGAYRQARLTRVANRLELWLGTETERFPLLTFLTSEGDAR